MANVYRGRNHRRSACAFRKTTEMALQQALHRYTEATKACPLKAPHRYDDRSLFRRMTAAVTLASAVEAYREVAEALQSGDNTPNVRVRGSLS